MKVGMIGGKTSTIGFRALGVETYPVPKPTDAHEVWEKINPGEFGIIFVTEPVYEVLKDRIQESRKVRLPVITVIPAVAGSTGVGRSQVKKLVEKAVGTDIMTKE